MMIKKILTIGISALLAAGILVSVIAFTNIQSVQASAIERRGGPDNNPGTPANRSGSASYALSNAAVSPLSTEEEATLIRAIEEEYGALYLYQQVISDFGSTAPFSQIARSEQQHVNALLRVADRYGVSVPEITPSIAPSFDSLASACEAGVAAEIADAALYDELMTVTTHADVLQVYTNLQSASLNKHLPAFQSCQ